MRVRYFSLISYAPTDFILDVCKKKSLYYAFIMHDKDINEQGELITAHTHVLLQTVHAHEPTAVCKWFRGEHRQNTFAEEVYSTSIYDYLTHNGFEDKFQYSEDDIISNDINKFKSDCDISNIKTMHLLDDINTGKSLRYLASTYGRDFVLNSKKYITYANAMKLEEKFHITMLEISEPVDLPVDFTVDSREYERFEEYMQLRMHFKNIDK